VGDVLRLFPAWPNTMSAEFANLRTQRGFLVSAKGTGAMVQRLEIRSTAGARLRMVNPFPEGEMRSQGEEAWEKISVAQGEILEMNTTVGGIYRFRPRPVWRRIRSQGTHSLWRREGDAVVMRLTGKTGQSNGYRLDGLSVDTTGYPYLEFEIRGSTHTNYFVEALAENGQSVARTLWQPAPNEYETARLTLPKSQRIVSLILYTMAKNNGEAMNAFRSVAFVGPKGRLAVNLTSLE